MHVERLPINLGLDWCLLVCVTPKGYVMGPACLSSYVLCYPLADAGVFGAGVDSSKHNYMLLALALFQFPYIAWLTVRS